MTDHEPRPTPGPPDTGPPDTGLERRLRAALDARAATIEPAGDGLSRIEELTLARTPMTTTQRWILGGVAAAAVLLVVVVLLLGGGDDGTDVATDETSTTTTEATTTTTEATTTTTVPAPAVDPFAVAFPSPTDSRRFEAPVAAARAYATDVLGFTDLALGDLGDEVEGDEAEVVVSDREDGPETRIRLLRGGPGGTWFVTGSVTDEIAVAEPAVGAALATPFATRGRALAFEGTVDVLVLAQGDPVPRGTGFVTGSGVPPAGPFEGRLAYAPPAEDVPGVLVFRTLSPEDGHVEKATSFPVRLTPNETDEVPELACADTPDEGEADPEARVVKVYFHCGTDLVEVRALRRTVPAEDPAILTNTVAALLAGPTDAERDAGFTSVFPVPGASSGRVVIADGVASVDLLGGVDEALPPASATILALQREVFRTATQFSSVAAVEITFDGSCEAFAEWAQGDSCLVTAEP